MLMPEKELWLAVLKKNLDDATAPELSPRGDHGKARDEFKERRAARAWLGSASFATVCHLAGLDPAAVLHSVKSGRYVAEKTSRHAQSAYDCTRVRRPANQPQRVGVRKVVSQVACGSSAAVRTVATSVAQEPWT